MERHFYSLYLMKFDSLAKRTFLFISLCCLSAPAVAECSKDEYEFQLGTLKSIFTELKDLGDKKMEVVKKDEGQAKFCQIEKRMKQLNRAYLSVDTALEKSCPSNYEKYRSNFKIGRDICIKAKSIHQKNVDICTKDGF